MRGRKIAGMNGWGRIGAMGGSLLLAMTFAACGATPSGASAAHPDAGHRRAAATRSGKVRSALKYGSIPWPSQLTSDKTDPKGYVLTSKAQIKKPPKSVGGAGRTALKNERQHVGTAWVRV